MSLLQKQILCPFCFETFRFRDAWFRCKNQNRKECPREKDKSYSRHMGVPHVMSKAFPPPPADFWARDNHEATCPQCREPTTIRLCEHCHSPLPSQIENVDSKILAVIGGISSGKSHYIATLVQQLTSVLGPSMRIRVMSIGDLTRTNYDKHYREPVYQNRTVLIQTQSAKGNPVVRQPLIYRLEFPQQWFGVPGVNLVLFDAAGEDVQDENTLALYNKYVIHAAGIIFLISPSQVPAICEQIGIARDGEPFEHTLSRIVELFEREGRLPAGRQIGVPTAFVLSKSDLLAGIVDKSCAFLQDVPHSGTYDPRESEMVHEEIKGYLAAWGADGLMSIAEKFRRHSFFAVSALGCKPENNTIPRIDPIRCGDPLLWVLDQIGCERFGWGSIGRIIGRCMRFSVWLVAVYVVLFAVAAFVSPMLAGIASVAVLIVGAAAAIKRRDWTLAAMGLGCAVATLAGTLTGNHFRGGPTPSAPSIPKEVATVVPRPLQPPNDRSADIKKDDSSVPSTTVKPDMKVEAPSPSSAPGWPFDAAEAARRQEEAATAIMPVPQDTVNHAAGKMAANRGPPPPTELKQIEGQWQWSNRQGVEIAEGQVKLDGKEWGTARWSHPGQFELWNSQEQLSQTLHLSKDGEWLSGRTPKGLRVWGRRGSDPLDPTPEARYVGTVLDCDDGGHGLFVDLGSRNGLKTGSLVNVHLSAHPVKDERGKQIGLLKLLAKVVRLDTWTADVELMARPEVVAVRGDKVELLDSDRAGRRPARFKPRFPPRH